VGGKAELRSQRQHYDMRMSAKWDALLSGENS
jgi:hypothetical protein